MTDFVFHLIVVALVIDFLLRKRNAILAARRAAKRREEAAETNEAIARYRAGRREIELEPQPIGHAE